MTRRNRKYEEHMIQKGIVSWARAIARAYRKGDKFHPLSLLYAIPNGEVRPLTPIKQKNGTVRQVPIIGKRLKDEGALAGIPDLCLPWAARGFHAMYIEVKAPGGRDDLFEKKKQPGKLSEAQKEVGAMLIAADNRVEVVYTTEEGITVLKWYLLIK